MRIRSIKPEFWRSDDVNSMLIEDRLLFIGLWSYVDDNGVGIDRQSDICADLFAHDLSVSPHDTLMRVQDGLNRLDHLGVIRRYTAHGKRYLEIVNWKKHQRINRPSPGRYPRSDDDNAQIHEPLTEDSRSGQEPSLPGTGEQGNRGTGRERRKTSLPPDWKPTDTHAQKCTQLGIDMNWEATKFKDNAEAKGLKYVNWDKAFHTWLNRSKDFQPKHRGGDDLWSRTGNF